jgi:uncharacterized protein YggE
MVLDFEVQGTQRWGERRLRQFGLLASSLVLGAGSGIVNPVDLSHFAQAAVTPRSSTVPSASKLTVAQFFYPPADPTPVLRVIGKGQAKLPADLAELTFEFGTPESETSPAEPSTFSQRYAAAETAPVSELALQSVLKALLAIGVPKDQIRMTVESGETSKNPLPFPLPFPSKATISGAKIVVKQPQPTQAALSKVVSTARSAAAGKKNITLKRVGVNYTLKDCQALEIAVYQSAVQNAQGRAAAIATAMNAKLNPVPSVAQPFYDLFFQGCGAGRPFSLGSSSDYDPNAAPDVELSRQIFVTYTLKP